MSTIIVILFLLKKPHKIYIYYKKYRDRVLQAKCELNAKKINLAIIMVPTYFT